MAFNVNTQPIQTGLQGQMVPGFNSIWYKTTSDLAAFPNYRYVFVAKMLYPTAQTIGTLVVPPVNGSGIVDMSKIVKNYLANYINPYIVSTQMETGTMINFFVDMGEQVSGAFVTAVANQGTKIRLTLSGTYPNLDGKGVASILLPGLTLSATTFYLKKITTTTYDVYSDAALTVAVTATAGSFTALGAVQVTDYSIPINTTMYVGTTINEIDVIAHNAIYQYEELHLNLLAYDSTTNRFLTNSNPFKPIKKTDYETLSLQQQAWNTGNSISTIRYTFYDESGTILQTTNVSVSFTIAYNISGGVGGNDRTWTNSQNTRLTIPVGYQNLVDAGIITSITPQYYTVQCFDTGPAASTPLRTYYLSSANSQHWDSMQICWVNPKGGIDYYRFNMVSDNSLNINKQVYKKPLAQLSDINASLNLTGGNRGETVYHSDVERVWTLISDLVNYQEANWLSEIFTSPEVYLVRYASENVATNMLVPVVVQDQSYGFKIKGKEKTKQITITLKGANKFLTNV